MKKKVLAVLGEGGHTKQMLALVDELGSDYVYGYLLVKKDSVSKNKIRISGPVFYVKRPRDKKIHILKDIFNTLHCGLGSIRALLRFRPDVVISCGPGVAVPVSVLSKLSGIGVIFIETGSTIRTLSLTGRILYRFADLFFIQWPSLQRHFPRSQYRGRLF